MTYDGPTIDKDGTYYYSDGSEWDSYVWKKGESRGLDPSAVYEDDAPDHGRMVAELLLNEVLFCSSRRYMGYSFTGPETLSEEATIVCYVICNDIFAWACADAECVSLNELPKLYDMWKANPAWGAEQWCILKRNQRPQAPVLKAMQNAGAWTEELEAIK